MNKHQQSGMTTLLITSMLLIVALLFSLASYKNLFYQIKRTQNEVLARQAHWAAEGGLECGFVELKQKNIRPTDPTFSKKCTVLAPISELSIGYSPLTIDQPEYELISHYSNAVIKHDVSKSINYGGVGISSTLETSASVELTGSQHFVPNKTNSIAADGKYKCRSIISGGTVTFTASESGGDEHFFTLDYDGKGHASGPAVSYPGYSSGVVPFICNNNYKSNYFDVNKPINNATNVKGGDILENQTTNIFKNIFGKEISDADSVKEEFRKDPLGIVLGESLSEKTADGWVINCSDKVKVAYNNDIRRFWINGSCALTGDILGSKNFDTNDEAIQLVIFNGLFTVNALPYIDGLIYQYIEPSFNIRDGWEDFFDSNTSIGVGTGELLKDDIINGKHDNMALYTYTSLTLDGGIGIDAPNRTIKFFGAIIPAYNEGKSGKYLSNLSWQQGSWHDF
ncbi:hypothetical protein GLP24_09305 [Photobacterium carnosum]|uniref:hypothetical protein n=1 Tax=Photobacterium carnosum TaxID=2023717 RepID=UPI001E552237|nr:hypothetical protein [Photobacterium carnosum]MCD9545043.1 hypothetical protein [Photobacterium carnosum]